MAAITLNGNVLSTENATPSRDARFTNYLYIKGRSSITADQKRQLADIGVTIFEYLGNDTYLCRYEPADLEPIRALPFVEQANVYPRRVKTSAALGEAIQSDISGDADPDAPPSSYKVDIVLHKGEDATDDFINELVEKTGLSRDDIIVDHNKIRLTADAGTIAKIGEVDAVKSIEEFVDKKLFNNIARHDMEAPEGDILPNGSNTYQGRGQVVSVADTGFDRGSTTDTHPAFKGRVQALISLGRRSTSGKANDPDGHGTHVSGSILGDGQSETMGGKIQGTAPKASLVLQSLLTEEGNGGLWTPANLWDLFEGPYKTHNARIASNSWGPGWVSRQLPYDSEAGAIDRFVWHNPDHVILFAAGNDGQRFSASGAHIGSSSAAKNCIAVGATESSRGSSNFKFDPLKPSGNPNSIAAFSSRGPTIEGRIKPDVVAPGIAILSASSRDPAITARARNEYGTTKDPLWQFSSGTSMATPLVAGCCAVIREALLANDVQLPSAALVKALLVNGAVDLGRPRSEQGFGRVDLRNSLLSIESSDGLSGYADVGTMAGSKLQEGETWTHEINLPAAAAGTFKATMAYSDRYGPVLQNDLTLKVQIVRASGATEKRGDEGFRAENNVEQVSWKLTPGDTKAIVTVVAERIARLDDSQAFAVAWSVY